MKLKELRSGSLYRGADGTPLIVLSADPLYVYRGRLRFTATSPGRYRGWAPIGCLVLCLPDLDRARDLADLTNAIGRPPSAIEPGCVYLTRLLQTRPGVGIGVVPHPSIRPLHDLVTRVPRES